MRSPANFIAILVAFENVCCDKKIILKKNTLSKAITSRAQSQTNFIVNDRKHKSDRAAATMQIKFYFTGVKINYKRQTFENTFCNNKCSLQRIDSM